VKPLMKFALVLLSLPLVVFAEPEAKPAKPAPVPMDATLTDPAFFTKPLADVYQAYHKQATPEQKESQEKLRAKMLEKGVDVGDQDGSTFQWLSGAHDGLRAEPQSVSLFGEKVGEVIVRGVADGKPTQVTVSLYNRGDDGGISPSQLTDRATKWKQRLDGVLAVPSETREQRGAVNVSGWMWRKGRVAWLLESSVSKSPSGGAQAEFLRLRIASLDATTAAGGQPVRRSGLSGNVEKKDNGDVFIANVPMVDQGQKGYCAVASAERVARYYGLEVDQHEIAQLAKTGNMGTSLSEMEEALKRVTGKLHVRTTKQFDLDMRQYIQDVKSYNQAAKKANESEFLFERNEVIVNPLKFWSEVKPEIFLQMKTQQSGFNRFTGKIEEYVDQGIPLCWALQLGMFKETGIPQTHGGHMRLLIGYNSKTQELLYTDSWGKGHELKRMPAGQAWCMTMALYTMAPTK
jgi:hypothetical protein